jgi:two-component system, NarL family, response regulator NreC
MSAASVLIVDRLTLVRRALREMLRGDGDLAVVAEAPDLPQAIAGLQAHRPDVVLLGPGADTSAVARLRSTARAARLVVISDHGCRCGAAALRLPEDAPAHLVRAAVRGRVAEVNGERLSIRERDVLRLIGLGHTNPEIARRLGVSVRTVEAHRARLQRKLAATSRSELVRHALDRGLVA